MKTIDRVLQRWRIAKVLPYIPDGARLLDIGCYDAALFEALGSRLRMGIGLDPNLERACAGDRYRLIPGRFPDDVAEADPFDAITLLAVIEHIPRPELEPLARDCERLLNPGGVLVITVPSRNVHGILTLLRALRLIHGMSLELPWIEQAGETAAAFSSETLTLWKKKKFQLGLNNLFVFRKRA